MTTQIEKCFINHNENLIIFQFKDTNTGNISNCKLKISDKEFEEKMAQGSSSDPISNSDSNCESEWWANIDSAQKNKLILEANESYRALQYDNRNKMTPFTEGSLPISFLIKDKNIFCGKIPTLPHNVSSRYLINSFIHLMKLLLFKNENIDLYLENESLFDRDDKLVPVPISENEMGTLYENIMEDLKNSDEYDTNVTVGEDDFPEENTSDLKDLMKLILQFLFYFKSNSAKALDKTKQRVSRLKRSNTGGVNVSEVEDSCTNFERDLINKNDLSKVISSTTRLIEESIFQNRTSILKTIAGDVKMSAIRTVVDIIRHNISNNTLTPLYVQTDITLNIMMESIGELITAAFHRYIPKISMTLSLQAALYNAAFLYKMGILDHYKDYLFVPVVYRLTFSCFKTHDPDNSIVPSELHYNAMIQHLSTVDDYRCIQSLVEKMKKSNQDDCVEILSHIALRINISDDKCMEALYWLLDRQCGSTYQYYIIVLTNIYSKSQQFLTVNKRNKISNMVQFTKPLYDIMRIYSEFVNEMGIETALSSQTIENFNKSYGSKIHSVMSEFVKSIGVLFKPNLTH